ncbi:MAG: hypothetical protein ACE5G8_17375 [Anaerolineae bacterium]
MSKLTSPFATPMPDIPIKPGAPPVARPTKEEIAGFPAQAKSLLQNTRQAQANLLSRGDYNLEGVQGKHFLLAGATGPGIGGALAVAVLNLLGDTGSLTVLGRDLSRSVNYETGKAMQAQAEAAGLGHRFHWTNGGMALDGKPFDAIVAALNRAGAKQVIYVNTVAAANSGLLPGMPPVYVKDINQEGLLQWQLTPLDKRAIETTKFVMGTLAVEFPRALEAAGIGVEAAVFADWRGSLDKLGRDPARVEYGRQGAYSTSLYLPKEIIQQAVSTNYGSGKIMMDIFYPVMRTRALPFIPGGLTMARLFDRLMRQEGIRRVEQPELALNTLHVIAQALTEGYDNPFPRLDKHEMPLDEWFYEVVRRINNDEESDFYYKRWLE